jgi:hypothetical protein
MLQAVFKPAQFDLKALEGRRRGPMEVLGQAGQEPLKQEGQSNLMTITSISDAITIVSADLERTKPRPPVPSRIWWAPP